MSPGKDAYEARRRIQKAAQMAQENAHAEYMRKKDQEREVGDLLMDSVAAFLRGDAHLTVSKTADGTKIIRFQR